MNNSEFELPKPTFRKIYRFPELLTNCIETIPDLSYWEYLYEKKMIGTVPLNPSLILPGIGEQATRAATKMKNFR